MVAIRKRWQLERHITGDAVSESAGWHARRALDVGERFARWGCWREGAVKPRGRPNVEYIQLPPGLAAAAAEETYLRYLSLRQLRAGLDGER